MEQENIYNKSEEEKYLETEEFLNQYLPSEDPTEEEYIHAYQIIQALRESKHPHRSEEHQQLAIEIERGLPHTSKGFNLLEHQIEYEARMDTPRTESLVSSVPFLDFANWQSGYASHRLWKMISKEDQPYDEREAVERIVWRLQRYSYGIYKQSESEYVKEEAKEKENQIDTKKQLNIVPKKVQDKTKKIAEETFLKLPKYTDELKENTERYQRLTTYFQLLLDIYTDRKEIYSEADKFEDFWMTKDGELLLSKLLTSNITEYRNLYYDILVNLLEPAQRKNDTVKIGRIGTRHALRTSRIDPFSRDFTQIEYWQGLKAPKKDVELQPNDIRIPKKYDGDDSNGFEILRKLLKYGDDKDKRIYRSSMEAFLKYIKENRNSIKDYEIVENFFKTQYSFDMTFNLGEREEKLGIEQETSFKFILHKYLWLKYGPEYTEDNPTEFDKNLWKLQKNILLKGIKVFEGLFSIQKKDGQDEYEIQRDFYQEAKNDLKEQYTDQVWDLIRFAARNPNLVRDIFRESFAKFQIDLDDEDKDLFYTSVLLGTLDFAIAMKQKGNLENISASSLRFQYGTKLPTAFEEVSQKAEEELVRWRFRKDEKDPSNPKLKYDNNLFNTLRNLSVMWGRGYGTSVFIQPEGLLIKNPLHTMGEERETLRNGTKVKERQYMGGRDEVLIPWDIISKAVPQFDYIPWADSVLKLVGRYRATIGRRDLDWISDLASKGPAIIRFEAAGSERMYELPPLPNAREMARILKEIASQMNIVRTPDPKDILKKIE